jgi:hypothetical protein
LDSIAQAQLRQQVTDMGLDRGLAHYQLIGDLSIGQTSGDEPQHVDLARR